MNTSDVMRKLGCGEPTIKAIVDAGFLSVNERILGGNGKRQTRQRIFESREINALAKVYHKKGRLVGQMADLKAAVAELRAKPEKVERPLVIPVAATAESNGAAIAEKPVTGITSRLDRIETMLAKLLEIWS
jgi:hypothetical protein